MDKKRVLFLCVNNSARSQMAEGLINHDLGDRFEAFSAGDHPTGVRPQAIEVMAELGIDITQQHSKNVSEFDNQDFDWVISLCSGSAGGCPLFIGAGERIHIEFNDPAEAQGTEDEVLAVYRSVRDAIRDKVESYLLEKAGA